MTTTTKKPATCSGKDCDRAPVAKGMCSACYTRARRQDPDVRAKAAEASRRTRAKNAATPEAVEALEGKIAEMQGRLKALRAELAKKAKAEAAAEKEAAK